MGEAAEGEAAIDVRDVRKRFGTADEVFSSSDATVEAFLAWETTDFTLPPRRSASAAQLRDQA